MRISDTLVVQLIEDNPPFLVLVDDAGQEERVPAGRDGANWIREHAHRDDIETCFWVGRIKLSEADWAAFCFAMGYFHFASAHGGG